VGRAVIACMPPPRVRHDGGRTGCVPGRAQGQGAGPCGPTRKSPAPAQVSRMYLSAQRGLGPSGFDPRCTYHGTRGQAVWFIRLAWAGFRG